LWIVIQLINGMGSVAATSETAGVAYMAHIGGFVAWLLLVKLMASPRVAMA
jgi:membrane associated rhomboid family serine protease